MKQSFARALCALPCLFLAAVGTVAQEITDLRCESLPVSHCGESCAPELLRDTGNVIESATAERYNCDRRARKDDIVDTVKGYVTGQSPGRGASWGQVARPGTAEVSVYPDCDDGRVVADVVRLDKGHTEGLEPAVTEALIGMMANARGGMIANGN